MRLWRRWTHPASPRSPGESRNDPLGTPRAALETPLEHRLRREAGTARVAGPPELRRRILRAINDRPRAAPAIAARRPALAPALALLAAAILLTAVIAPAILPSRRTADLRASGDPITPGAAVAPRTGEPVTARSLLARLISDAERPPEPDLELPLVVEARGLVSDARDATRFVLAHLPARYRPERSADVAEPPPPSP